jgi:aminopeptidase N
MNRWHGKHPIPWDFFYTINDASGKNLNWFWANWFFSNYYIDLSVGSVTNSRAGYTLMVKNIGGMAAPFDVKIKYTDGSMESLHQTAAVWESDQRNATVQINTKKKIQSLALDGGIYVDANAADNSWTDNSK